jgi:hypothetical protein
MPALAPITPAGAGQTIVSPKNDGTATEEINDIPRLKYGPADGTVAYIKRKLNFLCAHKYHYVRASDD